MNPNAGVCVFAVALFVLHASAAAGCGQARYWTFT
jgi:hypothetical protein